MMNTLVFMNILILIRIVFNMTYEDYKNNNRKRSNIIIKLFNKLFTVIIFTMLIVIISNYSPKFRNFIINDVLNNTINFSKVNRFINKYTNVFKISDTKPVVSVPTNNSEKYLDGLKYKIGTNEEVYVKDSGIVTFIGNKEGYNNTIIVQQSNGYYAWYGNIKEKVKLYDYLESGTVLGIASNEYYYVLIKDDKIVKIDEN